MKRDISDLLDTYMDESVDLYGGTPLSASRIRGLTMGRIPQAPRRKEGRRGIRRPLSRGLLIAAVIALLCCLTAAAIMFSLRDAARTDMGISAETPIPEWTEYEAPEKAGGGAREDRVALLATMCSGKRLYAYFEISPVPEEIAAILADNASPQYEWDLGGIHLPGGGTIDVEQVGYDAETETALVKVNVQGEALEQMEQLELSLTLTHNLKAEKRYDSVVIPVTSSEMFSCRPDVVFENTRADFLSVLPPEARTLPIPDYVMEGRINCISIYAGYIEIEIETPGVAQWAAASGADQVAETEGEDDRALPGYQDFVVRALYSRSWNVSVDETLSGARLNYRDGTSEVIEEIPSAYAGVWTRGNGSPESLNEGKLTYQFTPRQAFDLSEVASVTIGETEYTFMTGE